MAEQEKQFLKKRVPKVLGNVRVQTSFLITTQKQVNQHLR